MPVLSNLGFETDGAASGDADGWTRTTTATASEIATFGTDSSRFEEFSSEWSSNEGFLNDFGVADLAPGLFDPALPSPEALEDFEEGWQTNESFLFSGGSLDVALLGGADDTEDFELDWQTNQDWTDELGSIDSIDDEDFEADWQTNQDWTDELDTPTGALFGTSLAHENFESSFTDIVTTVDPATDRITAPGHGRTTNDIVSFRNEGGILPGGLRPGYEYFVVVISVSVLEVKGTVAGSTIDLTDHGVGTHFLRGDPRFFWRRVPE